jgi:hypothetical protein
MVFISLGFACRVRESIDRFNSFRVETNFFDWLLTNFSTVLYVMQNIDQPDKFLTAEKFVKKGAYANNLTHFTVDHNQLYLSSLHDFPSTMDYFAYMPSFLEKYRRRLERLKHIIVTSQETIQFMHMIAFPSTIPSTESIYYFVMAIKKMNENCKYYLHLLIPPDLHNYANQINSLVICPNIKIHYMYSIHKDVAMNEQRLDLNWNDVYKNISVFYK